MYLGDAHNDRSDGRDYRQEILVDRHQLATNQLLGRIYKEIRQESRTDKHKSYTGRQSVIWKISAFGNDGNKTSIGRHDIRNTQRNIETGR